MGSALVPLSAWRCQAINQAIPLAEPVEEPLATADREMAFELTNNIVGKIAFKLSLPNIVSDVRGYALQPKVLKAALFNLTVRNAYEKFLKPCQLNALITALKKSLNETKEILPPVYSSQASVLVNQNGYAVGTPAEIMVVLPALNDECLPEIQLTVYDLAGQAANVSLSNQAPKLSTLKGNKKAFVSFTFTGLRPGHYSAQLVAGGKSWPGAKFEVRPKVYSQAMGLAKQFFMIQRAHDRNKTYHGGVYADDPINVGGHLDAGDNNIYVYTEAPAMFTLMRAYELSQDKALLAEAEYGAKFLAGLVRQDGSMQGAIFNGYPPYAPSQETDGIKGNKDDRPLKGDIWGPTDWAAAIAAAVFAKCAYHKTGDYKSYLAKAQLVGERLMKDFAKDIQAGPVKIGDKLQAYGALISYNLTLFKMTREEGYLKRVKSLTSQILQAQTTQGYFASGSEIAFQDYVPHLFVEALSELYQFYQAEGKGQSLEVAFVRRSILDLADHLLNLGDPIFGKTRFLISQPLASGSVVVDSVPHQGWMTGTHRGANSYILSAANVFAIAHQLSGQDKYLKAANQQMNWVFGVNPFATSLMAGIGNSPKYYHGRLGRDVVYQQKLPQYAPGSVVPGGIINGIGERLGVPYLDLKPFTGEPPSWQTSEVWLPHVGWFVLAATRLGSI